MEAIKDLAIKGTDKLKDTTDKIRESNQMYLQLMYLKQMMYLAK